MVPVAVSEAEREHAELALVALRDRRNQRELLERLPVVDRGHVVSSSSLVLALTLRLVRPPRHRLPGVRFGAHEADFTGRETELGVTLILADQLHIRAGRTGDLTAATHFEFHIVDEGPGFDPNDLPDPTDIENLERPCGRGVMLIRHYMHEVEYFAPGNAVLMRRIFQKVT